MLPCFKFERVIVIAIFCHLNESLSLPFDLRNIGNLNESLSLPFSASNFGDTMATDCPLSSNMTTSNCMDEANTPTGTFDEGNS
jgi:hypothetical protein